MALPVSLGAAYEYKVGDECEFKCENVVPHETCKGEASVDGRKIRVTCDGKETLCPEGGITVL